MNELVCLDIETTGLDKHNDHIIQFSAIKVDSNYNIIDTYSTYIKPSAPYDMGLAAFLKHRIKPEFLEDKPEFIDVAKDIYDFINGYTLVTYNGMSCDIPFLVNAFAEVGITWDPTTVDMYDAYLIEQERHSNKLESVYERYMGLTMEDNGLIAHDALSDVKATLAVFYCQQEENPVITERLICDDNVLKYKDIDIKGDGVLTNMLCFNMGKYSGIPITWVKKIDKSYIAWCMSAKSGFASNTKALIDSTK